MDTKPNSKPKARRCPSPIGDHEVGYCRPPVATRFKKGQPSANPKGRPKGRSLMHPSAGWTNGFHELTAEEAGRPVQVRNGDKVETITVHQAVIRALVRQAAQGNVRAAGILLREISDSQAVLRREKEESIRAVVEYKDQAYSAIYEARSRGVTLRPTIHPDDIDVDFNSGDIHFDGPLSKSGREAYVDLKKTLESATLFLTDLCKGLAAGSDEEGLHSQLSAACEFVEKLNRAVPARDRFDVDALLGRYGLNGRPDQPGR
jgi:hypothetical protein